MDHETHWLDEPRNVKLLWRSFLGVLALTVVAEVFVPLHPHFEIEAWFAFAAWFGFGTCILMIVGAKCLSLLLRRRDTYYADHEQRHD